MTADRSDALVFFGGTGDLAYKKIFPALHAMTRRSQLDMPVIGVALSKWMVEHLRARARESVEHAGEADDCGKLASHLLVPRRRLPQPARLRRAPHGAWRGGAPASPPWVSPYHYGLKEGPIVLLIENYKSGLVWQLMRGCRYIVTGLRAAGFTHGRLANERA